MAFSPQVGLFAKLLQQLQDAHVAEVDALQQEIARLRDKTEFNEDAGAESGPKPGLHDVIPSVQMPVLDNPVDTGSKSQSRTTHKSDGVVPFRSSANGLAHIMAPKRSKSSKIEMRHPISVVKRLVEHQRFEAIFCILIFLNAMIMAIEVQYKGIDVGYQLEYPKSHVSAADAWPGAERVLQILSFSFGLLFTFEIVLKLVSLRFQFWLDFWNWIDLAVVVLWLIGQLESVVGSVLPNFNSSIFRLARLGRLLRLIRLVRKIQGFDSLFVMTIAIRGSLSVLFWTFILLSMVQMMLTLFLLQYLHEYYFDNDSHPLEERQAVFTYYGTFFRAFFSMFELTLANWPPAVRILGQNVSEVFFVFGLMHKLSIGFAVVGVINGVFIQETFKVASMDDVLMVRQKDRASKLHKTKMTRFLEEADRGDGDGLISKEEFCNISKDPQVKLWLSAMELDAGDAENLFTLIDKSHDGQVSLDELVDGVRKLKGAARQIDVITMMQDMQRSITLINHHCNTLIVRSLEGDVHELVGI